MKKIPSGEITFHPHSYGDQGLRLFRWRGGIYRAARTTRAPLLKELLARGVLRRLAESGLLIDTEVMPYTLGDFDMVLRHRMLPFVSYPTEWCAAMFKDAILTMLDLAIELSQEGYTVDDGHPWNLLIDIDRNCRPVFVDIGSIAPIGGPEWPPYDPFCRFCYHPLILMARGEDEIGRLLMWEDAGVSREQVMKLVGGSALRPAGRLQSVSNRVSMRARTLLPQRVRPAVIGGVRSIMSAFRAASKGPFQPGDLSRRMMVQSHQHSLREVRRAIESVTLPPAARHVSRGLEDEAIDRVINRIRPSSVLNVSPDGGTYSRLAAKGGTRVVALDTDTERVTDLYLAARSEGLRVLPLVMDPRKPTPARGFADHYSIAATERLQCDLVLAMSFVHSLVVRHSLRFDQIAGGLSSLTRKWALVEFVPAGENEPEGLRPYQRVWYRLENLAGALRKQFRHVSRVPGRRERSVLLLCEK